MKNIIKIIFFNCLLLNIINFNFSQEQKTIKSVKIGEQIWQSENLNTNRFRNGEIIPEAKTNEEWIEANNLGKPVWCHWDNEDSNGAKYGKLYNFYAVLDPRGIAPVGWHVPTVDEIKVFIKAVDKIAGVHNNQILKKETEGYGRGKGNNKTGFSALMGGYRFNWGLFFDKNEYTFFWSSTELNSTTAYALRLTAANENIHISDMYKSFGFYIRCIKDN